MTTGLPKGEVEVLWDDGDLVCSHGGHHQRSIRARCSVFLTLK
jgi:hypothetical protein